MTKNELTLFFLAAYNLYRAWAASNIRNILIDNVIKTTEEKSGLKLSADEYVNMTNQLEDYIADKA